MKPSKEKLEKKIWYRVLKILFILAGVFVVVCAVSLFLDYMPHKNKYTGIVKGSFGEAITYSLITVIVGFILLFIVKEIILYIIYGKGDKSIIEQIKKFLETEK